MAFYGFSLAADWAKSNRFQLFAVLAATRVSLCALFSRHLFAVPTLAIFFKARFTKRFPRHRLPLAASWADTMLFVEVVVVPPRFALLFTVVVSHRRLTFSTSLTPQNGISSSGIAGPKVWSFLPPETAPSARPREPSRAARRTRPSARPASYKHLRTHETARKLACRLLLEKKN